MSEKTYPYNPFDFIDTQEEIDKFLTECLNDEDPQVFIEALGYLVKKHGVADVAETTGLNRENLYRSFSGKAFPRWDTVLKVLHALNVSISLRHAI